MSSSLSRYRTAFYISQRFLDKLQVDTFPIDPFPIFLSKKGEPILAVTLQQYNSHNLHPLTIKDAKCFYNPGKAYLIIYNSEMPKARVRFSLVHELAHIVLNHLNDERTELCRGGVEDRVYRIMEGAANTFTGNFLAPPILIKEKLCGSEFSVSTVSSFFGLSDQSVYNYRYKDYKEWLNTVPTPYEESILSRCRAHLFPRYCMTCGNLYYGKDSRFCPICGNNFYYDGFNEGVMKNVIYQGVQQDQTGRAVICPRCGNEAQFPQGEYCMICGAPLYNRCARTEGQTDTGYQYISEPCEQGKVLPGNARYCPFCGNVTTYFQFGILKPWEQEYQEWQARQNNVSNPITYLSNKAV